MLGQGGNVLLLQAEDEFPMGKMSSFVKIAPIFLLPAGQVLWEAWEVRESAPFRASRLKRK